MFAIYKLYQININNVFLPKVYSRIISLLNVLDLPQVLLRVKVRFNTPRISFTFKSHSELSTSILRIA
jgi:hypothetical protein